jgi:uncharacterized protein (TIGR03086 family)
MSEISDRYRKNAALFTSRVEQVPADRWESPSPCEEWTARDIVRHAVQGAGTFLGFVGQQLPAQPTVDDDPRTAWQNARDAVQAALDDRAVAETEFEGFTGRSTFEAGVNRFLCPDLLVHSWDLSRATGLDEKLPADEVAKTMAGMSNFDEKMMRQPGVFGPAVEPPPGADEQTKMLAFLGRRA